MADETPVQGERKLDRHAVDMPIEQAFPLRTDMPWLTVERPKVPKPVPGPKGLRLRDVENEYTREVPDHWPYLNDYPRGSIPMKGPYIPAGYSIFDKISVWSDNAIDLYEDAIADRWSSATTIPWETITPLPEITEAAIDQLCTELSEQAYLDVQVLSSWLERISYGFKEVKNYLATHIFSRARHCEAFRKRALANGGGLGIEGPGIYHRAILGSQRFPDVALAMFLRIVWTKVVCEAVAARPRTEVDRALFSLTARDLGRYTAYIVGFLQHMLAKDPEQLVQIQGTLTRHELVFASEATRDQSFTEALALTLSDNPAEGLKLVEETRRTFVETYLDILAQGGVDRLEKLLPKLKEIIEPAGAAAD